MVWIDPTTITSAGKVAALANRAIDAGPWFSTKFKRLLFNIKNGRVRLPVFGAGGVGKSTLGKILDGADSLSAAGQYDESMRIEKIQFDGDIPGTIFVAPGQVRRAKYDWPELQHDIENGKSYGVINVVSYGYHAFSVESYKHHDVYADGDSIDDFREKYTAARRSIEIELLKKLFDGIDKLDKKIWMLTLIAKQDLWWSQRQQVREHYEAGEYEEIISDFSDKVGCDKFRHDYLPVSFVLENFVTNADEPVFATSEGYDLRMQQSGLNSSLDKLLELVSSGRP